MAKFRRFEGTFGWFFIELQTHSVERDICLEQLHNDQIVPITRDILHIFTAHARNGHISTVGLKCPPLSCSLTPISYKTQEFRRFSWFAVFWGALRHGRRNVSKRGTARVEKRAPQARESRCRRRRVRSRRRGGWIWGGGVFYLLVPRTIFTLKAGRSGKSSPPSWVWLISFTVSVRVSVTVRVSSVVKLNWL